MDLSVDYLGLKLRNPFVVGASPFGDTVASATAIQDAGASAIVLRSLFPEQLPSSSESESPPELDAAAFPALADYPISPEAYLEQIAALKKALAIPVIASLNGHRPSGWQDFASRLEVAGADAIELNFYQVVTDPAVPADQVELAMIRTVADVAGTVRIPVAAKLSPFHASIPQLAVALELAGAAGVVIFNRFYQPDVDTATLTVDPKLEFSASSELLLRLRWLAILSPLLRGSLAATGGLHTANDVVKALLTGADVVQLVSVLLAHGPHTLTSLDQGLRHWMREHAFDTIADFRGALDLSRSSSPDAFERANYIRVLQSRHF